MSTKIKKENPMLSMLQSTQMSGSGSIVKNDFEEKINFINVEKILPYHNQARKIFDEKSLQDLANSIESQGIIQPLQVIPSQERHGFFEVVSGERRLRAAIIVGLKVVPCMVLSSKKDIDMVALIENIQRADLHPLERAAGLAELVKQHKDRTLTRIAKDLGVSKQLLSVLVRIHSLPESIKQHFLSTNTGSLRTLIAIERLKNEGEMHEFVFHSKKKFKNEQTIKIGYKDGKLSLIGSALSKMNEDMKSKFKKDLQILANSI